MKKVAVIGHFAFGLEYLDGQTVKTKIITEELCRRFGDEQVGKFDTHGGIATLLKVPFQVFSALKKSANVIILPAHNGLRVNAPLLALGRNLFKNRKLHYVVIGGWLPEFIKKHTWLIKVLKSFDGIYVETNTMKNALEDQGFANVFVMPNCKKLTILDESELVRHIQEPYKLCTFSRVMKEKGIGDAVEAVKISNANLGRIAYTLDIFGQIDPGQTDWFEQARKDFPEYIRYCGAVPSDQSVDVIKGYFALLFPTCFFTEGVPGTIIDAYAAGVPVISSKWESFDDVMDDGVTGIGYSFADMKGLVSALNQIAESPNKILDMKVFCIEKAKAFTTGTVIDVLTKNIE